MNAGAKFALTIVVSNESNVKKTLEKSSTIDPAISNHFLSGRGKSSSWESGGAIWEEVREEPGGGRGRGRELRQAHEVWSRGHRWREVERQVGSEGKVTRCGHEWSAREVAGDYESLNRKC